MMPWVHQHPPASASRSGENANAHVTAGKTRQGPMYESGERLTGLDANIAEIDGGTGDRGIAVAEGVGV